jgi:cytochrome P450
MVEQMRQRVQSTADQLIARVEPNGSMDVIADLAKPLPVTVIAEMIGVPDSDHALFKHWSDLLAPTLDIDDREETYINGTRATIEFSDYLHQLIAERRAQPKDDLLSALIAAEEADDRLTEAELIATVILLLLAGHETTTNLIGNGTLALLRNPDQLKLLRDNPALGRSAVEELLRYDSPVQLTGRIAAADVEIGGHVIQAGQYATTLLGAANHDPNEFAHPEQLDITRADNHHLAFGQGIHFCLGSPLARMEGQIAFTTLLRRLPNLTLADDAPTYRDNLTLRGLNALPVSF